jgi:hypothetical protein
VAADLLNDRVIPFFDEHSVMLQRVLTDRGTEYCGAPERHEYELYLAEFSGISYLSQWLMSEAVVSSDCLITH